MVSLSQYWLIGSTTTAVSCQSSISTWSMIGLNVLVSSCLDLLCLMVSLFDRRACLILSAASSRFGVNTTYLFVVSKLLFERLNAIYLCQTDPPHSSSSKRFVLVFANFIVFLFLFSKHSPTLSLPLKMITNWSLSFVCVRCICKLLNSYVCV